VLRERLGSTRERLEPLGVSDEVVAKFRSDKKDRVRASAEKMLKDHAKTLANGVSLE
jgi:hypothetical protein